MILFCFRCDTDDSVKTVFLVILGLALAGVIVFFILFYKRESPYLQRFCKGIHYIHTLNTSFWKQVELYQILSNEPDRILTHQSNQYRHGYEIASICHQYMCMNTTLQCWLVMRKRVLLMAKKMKEKDNLRSNQMKVCKNNLLYSILWMKYLLIVNCLIVQDDLI